MDSYRSILDKISVLQRKASSLRENEKKRAVAEIRKLIELYDIQPADLFHGGKSSAATGKRPLPPKYHDPATGKTWNGHGKSPFWLKGDRDKYLIAGQTNAAEKIRKSVVSKGAGKRKAPPKTNSPRTTDIPSVPETSVPSAD